MDPCPEYPYSEIMDTREAFIYRTILSSEMWWHVVQWNVLEKHNASTKEKPSNTFLTLKMEAVHSSESSVNLYRTRQHLILAAVLFIVTGIRTSDPTHMFLSLLRQSALSMLN
jgi:hypothetical protein